MLETQFYLDTNIFLDPWNLHSQIDIFPSYWLAFQRITESGNIKSIEKVKSEIQGSQRLVKWLEANLPDTFFESSNKAIASSYGRVIQRAKNDGQFNEIAFASV